MKKLIIMAAIAVCAMGFSEAQAQKVIKDASGNVFIDVSDMPTGTFATSTLNTIGAVDGAANQVYKKLQIAKADLSTTMTWAEAVGLSTSYNSSTANGSAQGQVNTGCRTYSAEGNAGKWRVPTQRELMMIWVIKDYLKAAGVSFATTSCWSSTEDNASSSWYVNFSSGITTSLNNTSANFVRCVREVAN